MMASNRRKKLVTGIKVRMTEKQVSSSNVPNVINLDIRRWTVVNRKIENGMNKKGN